MSTGKLYIEKMMEEVDHFEAKRITIEGSTTTLFKVSGSVGNIPQVFVNGTLKGPRTATTSLTPTTQFIGGQSASIDNDSNTIIKVSNFPYHSIFAPKFVTASLPNPLQAVGCTFKYLMVSGSATVAHEEVLSDGVRFKLTCSVNELDVAIGITGKFYGGIMAAQTASNFSQAGVWGTGTTNGILGYLANYGDYITVWSDGSDWYIVDSAVKVADGIWSFTDDE